MTKTSAASAPRYEVTPLELFFDVVFAFAVSQLSHHLLAHLDWHGALETGTLLLAVVTVWAYTSWAATITCATDLPTLWMVLSVMWVGLFMNASIPAAFAHSGWAFAIPFLAIQLGRTMWTIVFAPDRLYRGHFVRVLLWLSATAPLWILGAAADADTRLLWWSTAAVVDFIGTWLAHPIGPRRLRSAEFEFDAEHMLERCRLFLIIALGETILTSGIALSERAVDTMTVLTGTASMIATVALWSLTFGRSRDLVSEHVEGTEDPVHVSRHAVVAVFGMVTGLIAVAVGSEKVILHPHDRGSLALSLLLGGGPIVFLTAQGLYLGRIVHAQWRAHWIGGAALFLAGIVSLLLPAFVALLLIGSVLAVLAIWVRRD
ncbi:MAG: low temperature requirement protein A [Planctomycetes bacterium]|nr:low temperature requirement protein A [Planctomycetota bacterium]